MTRCSSMIAAVAITLLFVLDAGACAVRPAPTEAPGIIPTTISPVVGTPQAEWEKNWDRWAVEAKKEGKVVIGGSWSPQTRAGLTEAFQKRYPIEVDWLAGTAPELLPKIQAERRAGIYTEDILGEGASGILLFKKAGLIDANLEKMLVLPEVLDPKGWREGGIYFVDRDRTTIAFVAVGATAMAINTSVVQPDEVQSFYDVLKPKWKGKIVMGDPTVSGAASFFFAVYIGEMLGMDYGQQLIKQDLTILSDRRLVVESLARGKYAIAAGPDSQVVGEFVTAGAPIRLVAPKEGLALNSSHGCLSLLSESAHPYAARVFINWLLSKEGQTAFSRYSGEQSRRVDVSDEWVIPEKHLEPGVTYKIVADTEEMIEKRTQMQKLAKDFFKDVLGK